MKKQWFALYLVLIGGRALVIRYFDGILAFFRQVGGGLWNIPGMFIPASNEPGGHFCMDIWRLPRGALINCKERQWFYFRAVWAFFFRK